MKEQLIHSFSVVLLAAETVSAHDSQIIVRVPFSFHVGDSMLTAGEYSVETHAVSSMLSLKSVDSGSPVMILSRAVPSLSAPVQDKLVFIKCADEYVLFQVWKAGASIGRELQRSWREIEDATRTRRDPRSIVATG
jgi:hypothetical protein